MDINSDITTVPLHLQRGQDLLSHAGVVEDSLAKGVPPGADLSRPETSAILSISDEAQTLAAGLEDDRAEEARFGDRSILGGVEEKGQGKVNAALARINEPPSESLLDPKTVTQRELNDVVMEKNQHNFELGVAQNTKAVAQADISELHMAMEAAAFQIPPEVNGTLAPLQMGGITEKEDPSLTPVDPSLESSQGPLANSVMGMDPLAGMGDALKSPAKTLEALDSRREMFTYGAAGDSAKSPGQLGPQLVVEEA